MLINNESQVRKFTIANKITKDYMAKNQMCNIAHQ